jgi:hypothetical protein
VLGSILLTLSCGSFRGSGNPGPDLEAHKLVKLTDACTVMNKHLKEDDLTDFYISEVEEYCEDLETEFDWCRSVTEAESMEADSSEHTA